MISVTAVDGSNKVLAEAGRRAHVDFAAPGADILAAVLPASFNGVRGTSFAAPIVASQLALRLDRPDAAAATREWKSSLVGGMIASSLIKPKLRSAVLIKPVSRNRNIQA